MKGREKKTVPSELSKETGDPAFLAQAKKIKLDIEPVAGEEIDEYVKQIYSMPEHVKKNLGFLVRSAQAKSNERDRSCITRNV